MAGTFNCPNCGAPLDYAGHTGTMRCPYCNGSVIIPEELQLHNAAGQGAAQPDKWAAVARLAHAGQKIEAIKVYRQMTGASLVEAKTAVEQITAGSPPSAPNATPFSAAAGAIAPDQLAEIKRLVQAGQKIEAIKLYRRLTGAGLKAAKDSVEALGGPPPIESLGDKIKTKVITTLVGLFFIGLASIFPFVFIPMGIESWQANQIGGALGSFIGAGVWALVWGGIGLFIIFAAF